MNIIILLITFVVIFGSLWIVNKNYKYIYAQAQKPQAQKPQAQKPQAQKPQAQQPQAQQPQRRDKINSINTNSAPTQERIAKGLSALDKKNKSGKVSSKSAYKDLVDRGYLQFINGKWTSYLDPAGKAAPPAISGGGPQKPNKPNGGGSGGGPQKPPGGSSSGGGPQKPPGGGSRLSAPEAYAPNPNIKKRYETNIGGFKSLSLFQWTKGGLKLSPDGRNISVSVNKQSIDGSGNNADISRNEIAIKPKNVRDIKSVSFEFKGRGYSDNLIDNKTGIFFQLKPTGTGGVSGNSGFRLGIKGGNLAIGYSKKLPGNGTPNIVTDSSGKPINMNIAHKFDIKMNGLSGKLLVDGKEVYLNGKTVANVKQDPRVTDKGVETNIKFGLEVPHDSWDKGGTVSGEYNNISINGN